MLADFLELLQRFVDFFRHLAELGRFWLGMTSTMHAGARPWDAPLTN
jgi:hypothetical protein